MNCAECGTEVRPGRCWHGVRGYERPRAQGGHHHLTLREATGTYLCDPCVARLKAGIPSAQQTLTGEKE